MKKRFFLAILIILSMVFVVACSGGSEAPSESEGEQTGSEESNVEIPQFMTVGGGSTGGVFFGVASGFAQLFSNEADVQASAQTTTGGGQNIQLLGTGEIDLAIADNLISMQAFNGEESFEDSPNTKIRAITNIYPTYFQQMVRISSDIDSMDDIEGKRMVVGGPGSGTENATRMVYDAHGYDYMETEDISPEFLGIAAGVEMIQNRQADGISSITPYPFSSFVELGMTGDAELISLKEDAIEKLISGDSPYMKGVIPADTYKDQEEDIDTVYMQTLLITTEDMDEDVVYELTKMIFDNKDYLVSQNNAFSHLDLDTAAEGITIPLHPGAERYFKEAGVLN